MKFYIEMGIIMQFTTTYQSPLGKMLLAGDEIGLTGIWFDGGKYFAAGLEAEHKDKDLPLFEHVKLWLDIYFKGKKPDFMPALHMQGSPFQLSVWNILLQISYGDTMTYGDIAKILARQRGLKKMAAQAVGGAVGHNKISIIVPCHRVIGVDGNLTGYGGGIDRKKYLLTLEGVELNNEKNY